MGQIIQCFLLEPVNRAEEMLRRFVFSDRAKAPCPLGSYHNASITLRRMPWNENSEGNGADNFDHQDPRWPKACKCGYAFEPTDQWQHSLTRLYARQDDKEAQMTLGDAPAGAMWHADWLREFKRFAERATPDGHILIVRTPVGDWNIDGPSKNGPGWTRTGTPPNITANPSIAMSDENGKCTFHAWMRNGYLVEC